MDFWRSWKYKNLTFVFLGICLAILISQVESFHGFLLGLGDFGYVSAFFAGVLFVSTFTVATGAVILLVLAEKLTAWELGLIAGAGAVLGDFLIFRLVRDKLLEELATIYNNFGGRHISHLLHTKYFSWAFPVFGAIIIASPLPDELGISLLGISKMKTYKFIVLSFVLNATGIFLVLSASTIIRP